MLVALTREVSATLSQCELTHVGRTQIDIAQAKKQHASYKNVLSNLNVEVVSLAAQDHLPDAVFVEDGAVVVDEIAVVTRMGSASRALEIETLIPKLAEYRRLMFLKPPATLDGGDVLRIGRKVYVGLSSRTNSEGLAQLRAALAPHGYDVEEVRVRRCLHLKTGVCFVGRNSILVNPEWVDLDAFTGLTAIRVPEEEPWSANALCINDVVLLPSSFPRTQSLLLKAGFQVQVVDISEFQKAEGGLTCLSILLENSSSGHHWQPSPA